MHILVQEINKRAPPLPFLCDILLKSLHFVKGRPTEASTAQGTACQRHDVWNLQNKSIGSPLILLTSLHYSLNTLIYNYLHNVCCVHKDA